MADRVNIFAPDIFILPSPALGNTWTGLGRAPHGLSGFSFPQFDVPYIYRESGWATASQKKFMPLEGEVMLRKKIQGLSGLVKIFMEG